MLDSVPNDDFLKSGYADLLRRAGRGNALEVDGMGVVRIGKQLGLSDLVDDAGPAPPETIRPDDEDTTRNARRYLGRR